MADIFKIESIKDILEAVADSPLKLAALVCLLISASLIYLFRDRNAQYKFAAFALTTTSLLAVVFLFAGAGKTHQKPSPAVFEDTPRNLEWESQAKKGCIFVDKDSWKVRRPSGQAASIQENYIAGLKQSGGKLALQLVEKSLANAAWNPLQPDNAVISTIRHLEDVWEIDSKKVEIINDIAGIRFPYPIIDGRYYCAMRLVPISDAMKWD